MRIAPPLFALALLGGCIARDTPPPTGDPVQLGSVAFEVPRGWQRSDTRWPGSSMSVWTPEPRANDRKESISVVLGQPVGAPVDDRRLQQLLAGSQRAYIGAKTSRIVPITTDGGLKGFSITVDFASQRGNGERYRRSHILLRDHGALVHVIYTAWRPDPERRALELVLASVRHEEASS